MAVDERSRRELYDRLEQTLGPEHADTAMALLPPVGWADVATKHDLDLQTALLGQRIATQDQRIAALDQKIDVTAGALDQKIDVTAAALDQKIDATKAYLEQQIRSSAQETVNRITWRVFAMMIGLVGVLAAFVVPLYS
jgi:hypothetical protein